MESSGGEQFVAVLLSRYVGCTVNVGVPGLVVAQHL